MRRALAVLLAGGGLATAGLVAPAAQAAPLRPALAAGPAVSRFLDCPPSARALGYSDALDKLVRHGVELGGLSNLAYDRRSRSYASTVDNDGTEPARVWFLRDLAHPRVIRDPLVLRRPGGTAYTGLDADDEGLAVQRDGRLLVSSETEPVIRLFGRDGVQRGHLRVPHRFRVAPAGQATANATLEGLTLSPDGTRLVASMEGPLSGDGGPDSTYRRMLVFTARPGHHPGHDLGSDPRRGHTGFRLAEQVGYRVDPGFRISEVQAYGRDSLLVMEAAYDPATGNAIRLYAVRGLDHARDVSHVANLSRAPRRDVLSKRLVANVTACPSLGAPAKETQVNPLMDNYEGMAVTPAGRWHRAGHSGERARVTLISDDNFSDGQTTRVLRLVARLP